MISPELRKQIFVSLPVTIETSNGLIGVHKEYAPLAKVTEYLKLHPNDIYIAIDFADDEIYRDETPANYVFQYNWEPEEEGDYISKTVTRIMGTRNQCTMNLHVYANWLPNYTNMILVMKEVLNALQFWCIFDLESLVDYPSISSIQSIDETDDRIMHRVVSCTFTYTNVIERKVSAINEVELTVKKIEPLPVTTIVDHVKLV